jgi:hypothetical protein
VEEFFSRANKILTTASELWEGAGIDPAPFCFRVSVENGPKLHETRTLCTAVFVK